MIANETIAGVGGNFYGKQWSTDSEMMHWVSDYIRHELISISGLSGRHQEYWSLINSPTKQWVSPGVSAELT